MNKEELISEIAQETKVSKKDIGLVLDGFANAVTEALKADDSVTLVGFGIFKPSERAARMGRNPQTGEPLQIAASKGVNFKIGKGLKDALNPPKRTKAGKK